MVCLSGALRSAARVQEKRRAAGFVSIASPWPESLLDGPTKSKQKALKSKLHFDITYLWEICHPQRVNNFLQGSLVPLSPTGGFPLVCASQAGALVAA